MPALLTSDGTLLTDDDAIRAALGGTSTPLPPVVAQLDALTASLVVPIITDYSGTGHPSPDDVKAVLDAVEVAAATPDVALAAALLPILLTVRLHVTRCTHATYSVARMPRTALHACHVQRCTHATNTVARMP